MTPELTAPGFFSHGLETGDFLSDLIGIAALAVTTTIILWLPAILQA